MGSVTLALDTAGVTARQAFIQARRASWSRRHLVNDSVFTHILAVAFATFPGTLFVVLALVFAPLPLPAMVLGSLIGFSASATLLFPIWWDATRLSMVKYTKKTAGQRWQDAAAGVNDAIIATLQACPEVTTIAWTGSGDVKGFRALCPCRDHWMHPDQFTYAHELDRSVEYDILGYVRMSDEAAKTAGLVVTPDDGTYWTVNVRHEMLSLLGIDPDNKAAIDALPGAVGDMVVGSDEIALILSMYPNR